jgi:(p)ppGpp synthase/HD superfamily hydrolase
MWSADRYNKALRFAGEWHGDQKVPGTEISYLMHLTQVCQQALWGALSDPSLDINLVMEAALLHDVIEDTPCGHAEVRARFGQATADGVLALSKRSVRDDQLLDKRAQMLDSLARIGEQPPEIALVKMADRCTNLQAPPAHWYEREGKIAAYLAEAEVIRDHLGGANAALAETMDRKMADYRQYLDLPQA